MSKSGPSTKRRHDEIVSVFGNDWKRTVNFYTQTKDYFEETKYRPEDLKENSEEIFTSLKAILEK